MFALIKPVITSTEGLCVAKSIWIPAALAFWARRAIRCSTFLPTTIIRSANSSTAITIKGNSSNTDGLSSSFSGFLFQRGSVKGSPSSLAFLILEFRPFRFLTESDAISRYLFSISFTHHLRPFAASDISVMTGQSRWGKSS